MRVDVCVAPRCVPPSSALLAAVPFSARIAHLGKKEDNVSHRRHMNPHVPSCARRTGGKLNKEYGHTPPNRCTPPLRSALSMLPLFVLICSLRSCGIGPTSHTSLPFKTKSPVPFIVNISRRLFPLHVCTPKNPLGNTRPPWPHYHRRQCSTLVLVLICTCSPEVDHKRLVFLPPQKDFPFLS